MFCNKFVGNKIPADLDGVDLTGILADPKAKGADRTIIWHYPYNVKVMHPDHNLPLTPRTAMRKGTLFQVVCQ